MEKGLKLKHDGAISIATASSRKSVMWKNRDTTWSELVSRLAITQRTAETAAEYAEMPRTRRDSLKDCGGYVGGVLKNGRRKAESIVRRDIITLDADNIPKGEDPWFSYGLVCGAAAVVYSTHSHTPTHPRLRIVIPCSRSMTPDEYAAVSRLVANDIGIDMFDDTTYEAHRLMYWPSTSIDAEYRFEYIDSKWLDVDAQLSRYKDWQDSSAWPVSSRKTDAIRRLAKKQGDPLEKSGIVGAFCRVYSVDDVIEQFLPEIYQRSALEGRYDYIPADSSAGLVVYDGGKFAFSHHATDPISGNLVNAFDIIRLHLFSNLDEEASPGTRGNKLPSFQAMAELAIGDEAVRQNLAETRLRELADEFDEGEDLDWLSKLSVLPNGRIDATIDNVCRILQNDPRLRDAYFYDEFRQRQVVCADLPWVQFSGRPSDVWTDTDDAGLRLFIEKTYGIDHTAKIRDAVDISMLTKRRHPVREYLESLEWDGTKRAESFFIDYLGAADNEYIREVTRKSLIGAVARVMKPGCKHDHILVLVGPQGCGKSTILSMLGKQWFSDSLYTVVGKDAYEQLQGAWIIEMGEMAATRKAELEQIKQFISKQSDSFRAAYARRTQEWPRQCAFFGSTNDEEFLKDHTGGRRFWPVVVTEHGRKLIRALTSKIVDQVWAEIVVRYAAGEEWHLSDKVELIAKKVQDEHTEQGSMGGLIEQYLDTLLPENWDRFGLDERLLFFGGGFDGSENGTELRTRVCTLELWVELFRGDIKQYTRTQAREITAALRKIPGWSYYGAAPCGVPYGKQRAFIRDGYTPGGVKTLDKQLLG